MSFAIIEPFPAADQPSNVIITGIPAVFILFSSRVSCSLSPFSCSDIFDFSVFFCMIFSSIAISPLSTKMLLSQLNLFDLCILYTFYLYLYIDIFHENAISFLLIRS